MTAERVVGAPDDDVVVVGSGFGGSHPAVPGMTLG